MTYSHEKVKVNLLLLALNVFKKLQIQQNFFFFVYIEHVFKDVQLDTKLNCTGFSSTQKLKIFANISFRSGFLFKQISYQVQCIPRIVKNRIIQLLYM